MQKYWIWLLFIAALGGACSNSSSGPADSPPQQVSCDSLNLLFDQLSEVEQQLEISSPIWNQVRPNLDILLEQLRMNLAQPQSPCYFLNHEQFPQRDRFRFIELLTEQIVAQDLEEGILYLIKLRGLFNGDEEITEYISEDLAHVALYNPDIYLDYYQHNPSQEEMLLNSTRWVSFDKAQLIAVYTEKPGAEEIVAFLEAKN